MKKIVAVIFILACTCGHSQVFAHLFRQKAKQIRYLKEQLVALRVYNQQVSKGNKINASGVNRISANTGQEQRAHKMHYENLRKAKGSIRDDHRVGAINEMNEAIAKTCQRSRNELGTMDALTAEEMDYVTRVHGRLLLDCSTIVQQTTVLTSSGLVSMSDDERLQQLAKLYDGMQSNYAFSKGFAAHAAALGRQRLREQREIERWRRLHGLKNK